MPDITLLNIGRKITVPDGQTILSAALAQGIDYPHGCKSGRCGNCKSRLAEGEVEHLDHSRFALPPIERDSGLILTCRAVPKGEASVFWLEDDATSHPLRDLDAFVVGAELLTHDILRLRLRVDGETLQFSAGQYATLAFPGVPARDYSMANEPGANELEFHIRRVPGGRTSSAIHKRVRIGEHLRVTGPRGSAHLRTGHTGQILAVAGGSGLAPILSILESAVAHGMKQPIRVYLGVREERDLYGLDRLAKLAERHGDLTVTPVLSAPKGQMTRRTGFVHDAVAADLSDLDGWTCYTAGPPAMIDALSQTVSSLGLRPQDLHADVFFTPESVTRSEEIVAAD
ncbi:2Fe-2S iron-sulfur cluster-binding protein [Thioclava sp. FR2]|uniref:2Fe-2S iron-sulfur cluster-binding protein n=1 Tax=Thioclava sp. FR2 TaxID=3445780 RepID=UPI003EC146BE